MKNWKVIAWLLLFFPLGLYYMFTYSNWSKRTKYIVTGFYAVMVLLSSMSGGLFIIGFLSGLSLLMGAIGLLSKNIYQKRQKNRSLILLGSSILLMGISATNIESVDPEVQVASETVEAETQKTEDDELEEKLLEQATKAVEDAEKESTKENIKITYDLIEQIKGDTTPLRERLEVVETNLQAAEQLEIFIEKLETAEEEPTRSRLDELENISSEIEALDEGYITRLDQVREVVESQEELVTVAEDAINKAETEPNRQNYEAAVTALSSVQTSQTALSTKLDAVKSTVESQEAQAKQAEEEKAKAEENQKAAEQESSAPEQSTPEKPTGEAALLNFLNTASQGELQAVSYIGPKRSAYIVEYRQANGPFTHSSQVTNVKQIGDGIYSNLLDMFN